MREPSGAMLLHATLRRSFADACELLLGHRARVAAAGGRRGVIPASVSMLRSSVQVWVERVAHRFLAAAMWAWASWSVMPVTARRWAKAPWAWPVISASP